MSPFLKVVLNKLTKGAVSLSPSEFSEAELYWDTALSKTSQDKYRASKGSLARDLLSLPSVSNADEMSDFSPEGGKGFFRNSSSKKDVALCWGDNERRGVEQFEASSVLDENATVLYIHESKPNPERKVCYNVFVVFK